MAPLGTRTSLGSGSATGAARARRRKGPARRVRMCVVRILWMGGVGDVVVVEGASCRVLMRGVRDMGGLCVVRGVLVGRR